MTSLRDEAEKAASDATNKSVANDITTPDGFRDIIADAIESFAKAFAERALCSLIVRHSDGDDYSFWPGPDGSTCDGQVVSFMSKDEFDVWRDRVIAAAIAAAEEE